MCVFVCVPIGEYRPDLQDNLAKSIQDKAAISKGGVFGTVAKRFSEDTRAKTLPGPGTYTAEVDSPKPVHRGNDTVRLCDICRSLPSLPCVYVRSCTRVDTLTLRSFLCVGTLRSQTAYS